MTKETIAKAATIDEAVEKAIAELGVTRDECQVEVLETPRKTLFGKLREAVVKVTAEGKEPAPGEKTGGTEAGSVGMERQKLETARQYLSGILHAMALDQVSLTLRDTGEGAVIAFEGEGMAVLIGHHGETLDALQYLVALTCNRIDGEYYRITLDCGNYREKREATLQTLASRIAQKVKKSGRSQLLEPMNPYERRIIHSVVSTIDGVSSKSKGEEPNRRVVILSDNPARPNPNRNAPRREDYPPRRPAAPVPPKKRERTMEEILKSDIREKEEKAELYSKIEL